MKKILKLRKSNTQFYTVFVRTFVITFIFGSGTIILGPVPTFRQVQVPQGKRSVPTVPVPQHC